MNHYICVGSKSLAKFSQFTFHFLFERIESFPSFDGFVGFREFADDLFPCRAVVMEQAHARIKQKSDAETSVAIEADVIQIKAVQRRARGSHFAPAQTTRRVSRDFERRCTAFI
jgi:hypothetical protein